MQRWEKITKERDAKHLVRAQATWAKIKSELDRLGVKYRLFGSLAHGDFRAHSDIDLLVLDVGSGNHHADVDLVVSRICDADDMECDLLFAEFMTRENVDAILKS